MGYNRPALDGTRGGNSKYDIYLKDIEDYGVAGWTDPEDPIAQRSAIYFSFIVIDNDYKKLGLSILDVTAAHEYFHALQFSYDTFEDSWWKEATSTWIEDEVYDDINDYLQYLYLTTTSGKLPWFQRPEESLYFTDGWHEYGSCIFAKYLSEKHGGSGIIKTIWDKCVSNDSLDAVAIALGDARGVGDKFKSTFENFTLTNFLKTPPEGYDEGNSYPDINIVKTYNSNPGDNQHYVPASGTWEKSPGALPGLSAHYVKFLPPALLDKPSNLVLKFKGGGWGTKIILLRQDNVKEIYDLTKSGGAQEGTFRFGVEKSTPQAAGIKEAILVVSNWDTSARASDYEYSASVVPQFREAYTPDPANGTTKTIRNLLSSNTVNKGTVLRLELTLSAPAMRLEADFSRVDTAFDSNKVIISSPNITAQGAVYSITYPLSYATISNGGDVKVRAITMIDRREYINEDNSFNIAVGGLWDYVWDAGQLPEDAGWIKTMSGRQGITTEIRDPGIFYVKIDGDSGVYYDYHASFFQNPPFTIEFRAKHSLPPYISSQVNSYSGANYWFDLGFLINALELDKVGIDFVVEPFPPDDYNNYFMETTDRFHTYRLTLDTQRMVRVYIDGSLRLQAVAEDSKGPNDTFNIAFFGNFYEGYWDYIAFKGGIAADPSQLSSPPTLDIQNLSINSVSLSSPNMAIKESTISASFTPGEIYSFPNPVKNGKNPTFHIECGVAEKIDINVYDISGDLVHSKELSSAPNMILKDKYAYEYEWDVSDTPSGVYVYNICAKKQGEKDIVVSKKLAIIR